jgi:iron complex transport system ATP-binding protein
MSGVSIWRWQAAAAGARVPIVDAVDWVVRPGERWALLGPNGAGKTTLLTVAAAVEFPSRGRVEILGRTLGRTDVFRLREEIGFVDARAGRRFAPLLTVGEVVRTGATQTIGYFDERLTAGDRERAAGLVELLGLSAVAGRRFADCSHGERTRTLIARALVSRPRLLEWLRQQPHVHARG